ncbi:hypothetical protein D3C80_875790 [compost metagenome]
MGDQRGQRRTDLANTRLASLLRSQHGPLQARDQDCQGRVHVVAAYDVTHFRHALVDRLIATFSCQGAAHQPPTEQIQTCLPAALEFFLLFDTLEVLLFPALGFFGHARVPRGGELRTG